MEERKNFIRWITKHKRQLVIAGVSIGALIMMVLGIKNRETIETVWNSLRSALKRSSTQSPDAVPTNAVSTSTIVAFPTPTLDDAVDEAGKSIIPYQVKGHLRNLPPPWHASQEKRNEAQKIGIRMGENQTWVSAYTKNKIMA